MYGYLVASGLYIIDIISDGTRYMHIRGGLVISTFAHNTIDYIAGEMNNCSFGVNIDGCRLTMLIRISTMFNLRPT